MAAPGGDPAPSLAEVLHAARGALKRAGIEEHVHEAEALVQHALALSPARLFSSLRDPVPPEAAARLEELLARRLTREPLAYITGTRGFYGREFRVDPGVLIPRPETELLVELALAAVARRGAGQPRIADIGTGSGVLAITLALEAPGADLEASDISAAALRVARRNAAQHGVEVRVRFVQGDLGRPLSGVFDVVLANLPYVRPETLARAAPELRREPELALHGGSDGLAVIRRLLGQLPRLLMARGGIALLEVDPVTAAPTRVLARAALPGATVRVHRDLAGLERCVEIQTPGAATPA
jgi:release factor glutamine methyltransferase